MKTNVLTSTWPREPIQHPHTAPLAGVKTRKGKDTKKSLGHSLSMEDLALTCPEYMTGEVGQRIPKARSLI